MYTIISGTNRPGNVSQHIANFYKELLTKRGISSEILYMNELPSDFLINNEVMGAENQELLSIIEQKITNSDKFIFVIPEYNGGFPGILKAFMDSVHPKHFKGKKATMVGLSAGRSGNLRGMDQFTNVLNYIAMYVLPTKPLLPTVSNLLNEKNEVSNEQTKLFLNEHIEEFLLF